MMVAIDSLSVGDLVTMSIKTQGLQVRGAYQGLAMRDDSWYALVRAADDSLVEVDTVLIEEIIRG